MAKKMTPKGLRDKAREMLLKAKVEEEKRYMQVGRLVSNELFKEDVFSSTDADVLGTKIGELKHKIDRILNG